VILWQSTTRTKKGVPDFLFLPNPYAYVSKFTIICFFCTSPFYRRDQHASCSSLSTIVVENALCLEELNLSNASPVLQRFELQAPRLIRLNLEGCRRLDHCQIQCPSLEQVNVHGSRIVALRFCKDVRQVLVKRWSCASATSVTTTSNINNNNNDGNHNTTLLMTESTKKVVR
jgi:hypothetical protein